MLTPMAWPILIALTVPVTGLLLWLHVPAALMLGPLAAGIVFAAAGGQVRFPVSIFAVAQGIVGCLIARMVPLSIMGDILGHWVLFSFGVVSVLAASCGLGWLMTRLQMLPGTTAPDEFRAIVNAHFKTAPPAGTPAMLGVIGGTAEWIFSFTDRISTTTSAADALVDEDREALAARIWANVAKALRLEGPMPPWQIVKEKRATFAATPAQDAKRPGPRGPIRNIILAGDWTRTGLPATIEGAIRSGETAARLAAKHLRL